MQEIATLLILIKFKFFAKVGRILVKVLEKLLKVSHSLLLNWFSI
jgi:hypothetical protein